MQVETITMNPKWIKFVFLVLSCFSVKLVNPCTQDAFDADAKACVSGFYGKLKQNPNQDCSSAYNAMKNCINHVFYGCKNDTSPEDLTAMATRAQRAIASESYHCEDGMLNSFKRINLPDCRRKAIKKVRKCAASFHKKFSEDKGSPALCRKYTKAKNCIERAFGKYCKKTENIQHILKVYQDTFNPYCPGSVDTQKKSVRSTSNPYGACSKREYLTMTRICMRRFVQTLQENPKKPCRSVFTKKLHNCAKEIFLLCHSNASDYEKQNIEKSFDRNRPFQVLKFCEGIHFQLSYPSLKHNQCKQSYFFAKHKCEESYVKTYRENKADESLCQKYAEAKHCTKNATLALCKDSPLLRDEVNFIYDRFNPFCFNLSDPPSGRGLGERVPRETGTERPIKSSLPSGRSDRVSSVGHGQSVNAKVLGFVVAFSLLILRASVS